MIIFEYRRIKTTTGFVMRPFADVEMKNELKRVEIGMLIDSGADITVVPFLVGVALGFTETAKEIKQMKGIARITVPYVLKPVTLLLGNISLDTEIAWSLTEDVPPLLGRRDIFNRFKIIFEEKHGVVKFAEYE